MARIVDPEDVGPKRFGRRAGLYPWTEWADGQWREVTRGVDYTCQTSGFSSSLYYWAGRNGMRAETRQRTSTSLVFRLIPKEGNPA